VSVVANVAINVDSSNAVNKLKQVQQGAQATSQAVDKLNATTAATSNKFKIAANGIKYFTDAAGRARAENGRFLTTAERAAAGIKLQGDAAQQAAGKLGGLRGAVGGLRGALVSIGAGALVAGMVRGAAAAEQLQLRLKLLSREYGETERVQQFVAQSAKTFGQSQVEAAAGVADVYARLRPLGTSLAEIETVYKGFNAVALASGTSAEAASGAFLQLSQALGSGRLQGDEFRSVAEQVPGILKLVANEMGVTVGQLKQLGSEGKITSDVLINALAKGFEENKGKISELLALSPAQRFKEFKDSTQALSNAMGSELLPAIVPVVKVATELLRLFGQLPGPMKTIIAAAIGLTAAFVALAPAISAIIGLLGGLSLATLAAAGPWVALAAGVTAAAVALAGYRTESQKIGAKAAAGDPAAMAAARNRMVDKQQEIALMKLEGAEKASPRSALGGSFAKAKAEFAQLKRDVTTGQTAAATLATAMGTPVGATVGSGGGRAAGGGADKAANDAKRAAEAAKQAEQQIQERLRGLTREIELNAQISTIKELQFQAEMDGNKELQARLQGEERIIQIIQSTAQSLDGITDQRLQQKILAKAEGEIASARQETALEMQRIEAERTKSFNEIITGLDLELALKTATTEQAREQLRLEAEIAKLKNQGFTPEQIGTITAKKTELAAPKTDQQNITEKIATLKDEIADLTSISNIAITSAEGIGNAFAQSFQGLIDGSMTAKEALGSFFKSVADMFLEMAAQIIAKQITMIILQTILKALGAVGGGGGGNPEVKAIGQGSSIHAAANGATFANGIAKFASGGIVSSPTLFKFADGGTTRTGLMGEAGPEAIMPLKRGADGSLGVQANGLREAMDRPPGGASGSPVLNMSFQSTSINGVEYVSREQLESAMAETRRASTRDGAKRGMTMTLDRIQNSSSTRRKVGI
jgi:tape measure domain-containing protein